MKVRMKPHDREHIHEYNYPEHHAHKLMFGTHDVIDEQGSCYRIGIDGHTYYMSKYDMELIPQLPEELFHV